LSFRELLADMADLDYEKISRLAAMGISPADLQQATGIRANTMPRTWAELFKQMRESSDGKLKEFVKGLIVNAKINIMRDVKMAPTLIMPDLEKEYLEKLNKKQIIF